MAYIESSLMMFRGESHKLLAASLPDENGKITNGTYGMVCRDGQIIWEILGRKGRQVVIPISRWRTVSDPWHEFTVVIDIDKGSYVLQGGVGQVYTSGFIVNDSGMMVLNSTSAYYATGRWGNVSVNGAVFYNPDSGRKLNGWVRALFGKENAFYGVGFNELANKLIKLTVDKHGMVEDEHIVDEISGIVSAHSMKYKGCDTCILSINDFLEYYTYNLKNHAMNRLNLDAVTLSNLRWLTDGKFAYLRTDSSAIYVVITSNINDAENVIYADVAGYRSTNALYCRYPYVYIWRSEYQATSSSSYVFRIVKLNVVTGDRQVIEPGSIKIGDVTFYARASDENGNPETPYYRLYSSSPAIFWNYNEYFDDGVMKDDLAGAYGGIAATPSGHATDYYAVYMDNLELRPSEHNMTVYVCNY